MEVPDKIFIDEDLIAFHVLQTKHDGDIEYIRKDVLLDWAKEMKEQVGLGLNAYDMGEENGKAEMLNALIDKLNSL